jgi:methylmalonyl-CoA mutase
VGEGGLSVASVDDLTQALAGIDLAKTPLFIRPGAAALPVAALLAASLQQQNQPLASVQGAIETDPLGMLGRFGSLPQPLDNAFQEMAQLTSWAAKNAPKLQTICAHGCVWHEGGASATQELAFTLATAVEYLRQLTARGIAINQAAPRVRFTLTVGSNLFMEIAKIRAARMLWAAVVSALGGNAEAQKLSIHVRTARFNKTVLDPYVNMLRTTIEAFAGAVGGCHSMQVGAFDEIIRTPDDFSQRIARNTQILLQKECDLDKVIDPAGGAWYVESLTDTLARQAWTLFQDVEKRGGMVKALAENFPQTEVAKIAAEKQKSLAQRRDVLVGTNQYANPKEKPLTLPATECAAPERRRQLAAYRLAANESLRLAALLPLAKGMRGNPVPACIKAALAGATLGEISRALRPHAAAATATPVKVTRLAVAYEKIRAAVECCAAGKGRPKVFLAAMGPVAQHKARADFSRGFFSLGGFDIIYGKGIATPEEAAQKAVASGAQIVVLCSTDDTYPQLVAPFVTSLKAAAPDRFVVLAGYPTEQVETYKQAGVDDFVHVRVNAVDFLTNLLAKIGVTL